MEMHVKKNNTDTLIYPIHKNITEPTPNSYTAFKLQGTSISAFGFLWQRFIAVMTML